MSQLSASQEAIENLKIEIQFQKVVLRSIDDAPSASQVQQRTDVIKEIKSLDRELKQLQGHGSMSSQGPAGSQGGRLLSTDFGSPGQALGGVGAFSPIETGSFTANLPITPGRMDRKRSHTDVGGGLSPMETKSRRTSPSPFVRRGSKTPSTSGDDLDVDFMKLNDDYIADQKRAEERARIARQDEDFARSIQAGSRNASASNSYSALDRIAGVPHPSQSANGSLAPPLQFVPMSQRSNFGFAAPRQIARPAVPPFPTSSGATRDTPSLPNLNTANGNVRVPGAWNDDSSSADDSEVEFISASSFTPNGRYVPLPRRAAYSGIAAANSTAQVMAGGRGKSMSPRMTQASLSPSISARAPQIYGPAQFSAFGGQYVYPQPAGVGSATVSMGNMGGMHGMKGYNVSEPISVEETLQSLRDKMNSGEFQGNLDQYDYVMNDPRKTAEDLKNLLENIKPDVDLEPANREGTPEGMKYPLYEHQKIALTWLKSMENGTNKGGILADDMGLGKTISALALILSRPSTDRRRKTTLIVGPVALVQQWAREINIKLKPGYKLSVHVAHGAGRRKKGWDELSQFDVVMTSYGTLASEWKRYDKYTEDAKLSRADLETPHELQKMKSLFPFLGPRSQFYRVILDEAQCVKNHLTGSSKAVCSLSARTRFCLTGTPMMNNIGELQSLIKFLRIRPYNDAKKFKGDFNSLYSKSRSEYATDNAMKKLQALLGAILLRRTKKSLIDGEPIISLPEKTEEIQHVVFNDDEQAYYNSLEKGAQVTFNRYINAGTVGKNYSNMLVILLRLRQCCCHPYLIQDLQEAPPDGSDLGSEELMDLARSLAPDVVARILAVDGNFECPICYDAAQNPTIIIPCGHDTCSECLTRISQQQAVDNAQNDEHGGAAKCPSCRGEVDMKKLINYTTFKKVHGSKEEEIDEVNMHSDDEASDSDSYSDSYSESDGDADSEAQQSDADNRGNLRRFIIPDTSLTDSEDDVKGDIEDGEDEHLEPKKLRSKKAKSKKTKKSKKGKEVAKRPKKNGLKMADLKLEAKKSKAGAKKYMKYLKKNWDSSSKIDKAVELLEKFQVEGQKTIIFSQFVTLLDLLQVPIEAKGWNMERYDGGMKPKERTEAIERFTDKSNVKIMLISLKAGNAGLNLVAASRVIILDPFWNPFIEMQAVDRAYRIGQRQEVEVHRILAENTVEDRIIALQEKKKKLVDAALDETAGKSINRLGVRELGFLFGVNAQ